MPTLPDIETGAAFATGDDPAAKEGFAAAAEWIALDRDNETFIYRKVDDLGARNLLYLQCEILLLRKKLAAYDRRVARDDADMDLKEAARTWEVLVGQCEEDNREAVEHMELIKELRRMIKEYHEALILQSQVAQLKQPGDRALATSRAWMNGGDKPRPDGSKLLPALGGIAKDFLDNEEDLVALKSHDNTDHLSRVLRKYWPAKREVTRDGLLHIGRFEERHIKRTVAIISVIVAWLLLLSPITALYLVQIPKAKLAMIHVFTIIFALSVALITNARRAELFAATAAYVAVLVVFVSNGIGDTSDSVKAAVANESG